MKRDPVPFRAPQQLSSMQLSKRQKYAAGITAIWEAGKIVAKSAGLARGGKALLKLNQMDGADCPGCAWPDPDDDRSRLGEYCENGAKAIAEEATRRSIGGAFFKSHSIQELSLLTDYELGQLGRLSEPLILPAGANHYHPISWEEAFNLVGSTLRQLGSPHEAIFYTSGRTSNEAAFLYQLFVRMYGTNNLPDCSNMCHESSGVALTETLGIGKGSVTLKDFEETDLILIMGQNPGTNHPRMLTALEKAKGNGTVIITANPIPEAGLMGFRNPQKFSGLAGRTTTLTDLYLPLKINSDGAMLKAIMLLMWQREQKDPGSIFDLGFIKDRTQGFPEFLEELKTQNLQQLSSICGLTMEQLQQAAGIIMEKPNMIICWAMGLTQHENAVETIQEVVNLLLLKGSVGKPGAGSCPVRGHSNVQGDRTMGIWEKPPQWFLENLSKTFGFSAPKHHGYDTVGSIQAMHEGRAKVFIAMGGNFHSATPDTDYTSEALQRCQLTVQVSTKLNRSHLVTGETALILPCLARTDIDLQASGAQMVSVENSMGVVHQSRGNLQPISSQLRSEPAIIAGMAKAILGPELDWEGLSGNYDHIREYIGQVIPGFEDYNRRLREPGGFYLPNTAREGHFLDGKAKFTINQLSQHQLQPDEYLLMTIRSHDQFNTTIYGMDDRYRGVKQERRVVFMNEEDMKHAGLKSQEVVDISSHYGNNLRIVHNFKVIPYEIPSGNVAAYFPETNPLVPVDLVARRSHTPVSKSLKVRIKKA